LWGRRGTVAYSHLVMAVSGPRRPGCAEAIG
jgi:hypothetical protein